MGMRNVGAQLLVVGGVRAGPLHARQTQRGTHEATGPPSFESAGKPELPSACTMTKGQLGRIRRGESWNLTNSQGIVFYSALSHNESRNLPQSNFPFSGFLYCQVRYR